MLSSSNQRKGNWKPLGNDGGEKGKSISKGLNCRVQRQRGGRSSFLCSPWSPAVKKKKKAAADAEEKEGLTFKQAGQQQ